MYEDIAKFFSDEMFKATGKSVEYTIQMVPIARLKVAKFERDSLKSKIKKIFDNWVPAAAGFIAVNVRPDGSMFRCDGRHRTNVQTQKGYKEWPALVSHGLSEREEADLWGKFQERAAPKSVEALKADFIARKPEAVFIVEAVNQYGFKLGWQKREATPISAVAALQRAHRLGVLNETLDVASAWHKNAMLSVGTGFNGHILNGLYIFIFKGKETGIFDLDRLKKVLAVTRDNSPDRILRDAENRANGRGDVCKHVAQEFHRLYDKGLPAKYRLQIDCTKRNERLLQGSGFFR